MLQAQQQTERQVILEGTDSNLVRQQRIGVFELGEQEAEHAADRGARPARLIEHRLEFDGFDPLPIEQSFERLAKEPGRQAKKEPGLDVGSNRAGSRLDAIDRSRRGATDRRLTRSGQDQTAGSPLV